MSPHPLTPPPLRALELYCGIGGCAAALGQAAEVVAAVDINRLALGVYRRNFPHPTLASTLEAVSAERLAAFAAELWWLSPPCQPFTRRGRGGDVDDPRCRSLLHLLALLPAVLPRHLALENVPGFAGSRAHGRLLSTLQRERYHFQELLLCPTQLGIPNRRRRYYLLASRRELLPLPPPPPRATPLAAFLDADPDPRSWVSPELLRRYAGALDLVDPADPGARTACFTAAYGRSPVRSGSYLIASGREASPPGARAGLYAGPGGDGGPPLPPLVRRFSPSEVLRLLGFPAGFSLPPRMPLANAWRLAGNSLSVPAVRHVLGAIPELDGRLPRAGTETGPYDGVVGPPPVVGAGLRPRPGWA
ncbi:MAG TPA: DNA cytosine methyltransferase [Thermoanaerobaculia bacterium]|nr:DNA cytosine methyltransferase [Thermoanaerobaculia bacterium]